MIHLSKAMVRKNMELSTSSQNLFEKISTLIEQARETVFSHANATKTLLFWHIGKTVNEDILENDRAEYGKQIVATLATQLQHYYGRSFEHRNLLRMMQFARQFPDFEIVSPAATQLSWSHIVEVLPLKNTEAKLFYLSEAAKHRLGKRDLHKLIERKTYERADIASIQTAERQDIPFGTFKDPYLLDALGLHGAFLEADLEAAILNDLEAFILEVGKGLAFVERQKRMIIDGKDFNLDLLFFSRPLKRLLAIELKLGQFHARDKGQMELYLKWLNRYERQENEEAPIGLILCAETSREQIELLDMSKDGIMVAEYWTALPPKQELELKIRSILKEAQERASMAQLPEPADD
jgi:predicted nuclease of restriction endonuclease-like (RecB) superfamily